MEGLDDSWNVSQFLRKEQEDSDDDEDIIPQFDGSIDEKPDKEGKNRSIITKYSGTCAIQHLSFLTSLTSDKNLWSQSISVN